MYQVTKGDRKYEMSDIAKYMYQILYGDTNFIPVVKKTLKVLHLTKVLLDAIMESYKDLDNLIMNENGHTIVHDLEMPLRWFSVGICKYKPGYKSHDLL